MGEPLFEPLNLDCLTIDPEDMHRAACALRLMFIYAELKGKAMKARLAENIPLAIRLEDQLQGIYDQLPDWAQW